MTPCVATRPTATAFSCKACFSKAMQLVIGSISGVPLDITAGWILVNLHVGFFTSRTLPLQCIRRGASQHVQNVSFPHAHWDAPVGGWLARQSLAESRVQLHSTHSRAVARHPAIGNTRTSGIGCSRETQPRTYTVHSSVKGRDARSRSSSLPRQRTSRVARRACTTSGQRTSREGERRIPETQT